MYLCDAAVSHAAAAVSIVLYLVVTESEAKAKRRGAERQRGREAERCEHSLCMSLDTLFSLKCQGHVWWLKLASKVEGSNPSLCVASNS